MKRFFALFLSLALLVCMLSACSDGKVIDDPIETGNNEEPNQSGETEYEYLFRDLPEEKYLTPATEFAGVDGS